MLALGELLLLSVEVMHSQTKIVRNTTHSKNLCQLKRHMYCKTRKTLQKLKHCGVMLTQVKTWGKDGHQENNNGC